MRLISKHMERTAFLGYLYLLYQFVYLFCKFFHHLPNPQKTTLPVTLPSLYLLYTHKRHSMGHLSSFLSTVFKENFPYPTSVNSPPFKEKQQQKTTKQQQQNTQTQNVFHFFFVTYD